MAVATCLAVVFVLAVLTTLAGRLHVALLGPAWLRPLGPIQAVTSSAIGTAWWTVLLTALSTRGLRIPTAIALLLAAQVVATALVGLRGRFGALVPRGGVRRFAPALAVFAVVTLVALLPVLRRGAFATGNDTLTYCSFAQWLSDHAYRDPVHWSADQPLAMYPAIYQGSRAPLSAAFLLAGVQALARASSPLTVYPAVSAFGLALGIGMILVTGRALLRWPIAMLARVGLVVALVPGPLVMAHHGGFLAQTFGVPALLGVLVALARARPSKEPGSAGLLLGLFVAWLAGVYLAFLPLAAAASAWWVGSRLGRRGTGMRLFHRATFVLGAVGLVVGLGLILAQGVSLGGGASFLTAARVGFHVDLRPAGFARVALGGLFTLAALPRSAEALRDLQEAFAPVYAVLAAVGIWGIARRRRAGGLCAAVLALGLGIAWYALVARDPWTGARGHTWNLLKLAQWSHPFVVVAAIQGFLMFRARPALRRLAPLVVALPLAGAPLHWGLAGSLGDDLEAFVGAERPLDEWPALRRAFADVPPGAFLAADEIDLRPQLPLYLGLLTYPRGLLGDWTGSLWVPADPERRFEGHWAALASGSEAPGGPEVWPVVTRLRGVVLPGVRPLGGQIGVVRDGRRAQVLAVLSPSDEAPGPQGCVWLGRARTRVLFFSPRALRATLALEAIPGPDARGLAAQQLLVDTPAAAHEVVVSDYPDVRVPVQLERGVTRAEIRFMDEGPRGGDRRRLCVSRWDVRPD